jgi:hypothetical protein
MSDLRPRTIKTGQAILAKFSQDFSGGSITAHARSMRRRIGLATAKTAGQNSRSYGRGRQGRAGKFPGGEIPQRAPRFSKPPSSTISSTTRDISSSLKSRMFTARGT